MNFQEQKIITAIRQLLELYESITMDTIDDGRERVLVNLLAEYYKEWFHREWVISAEKPHFTYFRPTFFGFTYNQIPPSICNFYRGFYCAEVIQPGDSLLDIGCGDGFLTLRFYGGKCSYIDALDIEPKAIQLALQNNNSPNIHYHLLDAVAKPFPNDKYDVIVLDGSIGHFSADVTDLLLNKIKNALKPNGIFVGSESLGREGCDHLQFFYSLNELSALFKPYFVNIQMRSTQYDIGGGFIRNEAYWRCSNDDSRLKSLCWEKF